MKNAQPISLEIVAEIAEREDVPPTELQPPIHSAIDTDALDSLYRSSAPEKGPSTVTFVYNGYTVVVDRTGDVAVKDRASASDQHKTTA
ncbi:HalOD1 output domain-containing protein [Natrinema salaciae]|uniref:Halobacterial output domain-containing protein n=1 Tax=Natrinema salaciae TaxID=1186196 RepID=A0A1H9T101_9EURY|nr:HalOD1 output domain-containing protein [Natrinema salaciae]SER90942.1 hypothetical protein SAMN04489841_0006 [Natrinema salaciae]